jgi:gamma-glutamyltranspeptidase/glutathione hydrolase
MVATAHPLATQAGLRILVRGGTAVDAAIAAQLVLGLVEPQSSGLGGGLLMLHWDQANQHLSAIDGLAAAPRRTTASLRTDVDGSLLPSEPSQRGGRSVGVPGALPALMLAHERHGRLEWPALVEPAERLAREGFSMPPYLHSVLSSPEAGRELRQDFGLYFGPDGRPLPVGSVIRHPAYAATMAYIASHGPRAWWQHHAAKGFVEAAQRGFKPSLMTPEDVKAYRPVEREPVCAPFLAYRVCTAPPPSFGGIAVLQILQMVQARAGGPFDFQDPAFLHLYAEAGKLAQADRRLHVGDPDHVSVPTQALVASPYAAERARLIDATRARSSPAGGQPGTHRAAQGLVPDEAPTFAQTSQLAVADRQGNVVSLSTTNNLNFGARLVFDGVVLNNAMTNFSAAPRPGETLANQMAPRKRPVTSMAPTIAFDASGRPMLAGGSAGGGPIVDYVAASLIDMLANGRMPSQAVGRPHLTTATPGRVQLEAGRGIESLGAALSTFGHAVETTSLPSGQAYIRRTAQGWMGASDPRRDGLALGQ